MQCPSLPVTPRGALAVDADYQHIGVDITHLNVAATVLRVQQAIPEVYAECKFGGPGGA